MSVSVTVLLGYGDGTFGPAVSSSIGVQGDGVLGAHEVAVGDFDKDGWPDLVTANLQSLDVMVLLGQGDGTFGPPVSYATGGLPSSVAVGDFNQDGWPDLVAADHVDFDWTPPGVVTVLLGHGDGTFAAPLSYTAGYGPWSAAVGDFDRDGWPDLVAANYVYASGLNGTVTVLLNQGGPLPVSLDIKPDDYPNSVNLYSRGVIPVAILGSDTFDVAEIDATTLAFGRGVAPIAHLNGHPQDVNYDGIMDLMMHFRTQETGIACGDESATLTGDTLDGQPFEGTDSIQTVGCRETRRPAIWIKNRDTPDTERRDGPVNIERK